MAAFQSRGGSLQSICSLEVSRDEDLFLGGKRRLGYGQSYPRQSLDFGAGPRLMGAKGEFLLAATVRNLRRHIRSRFLAPRAARPVRLRRMLDLAEQSKGV